MSFNKLNNQVVSNSFVVNLPVTKEDANMLYNKPTFSLAEKLQQAEAEYKRTGQPVELRSPNGFCIIVGKIPHKMIELEESVSASKPNEKSSKKGSLKKRASTVFKNAKETLKESTKEFINGLPEIVIEVIS